MRLRAAILAITGVAALFQITLRAQDTADEPVAGLHERLSNVLAAHKFHGEIAYSPSSYNYNSIVFSRQADIGDAATLAAIEDFKRSNPEANDADAMAAVMPPARDRSWPWASVTKQVLAVLVMQQVEAGKIDLDRPASRYLRSMRGTSPTIRQLLQHQSGLRNPDDSSPDADGVPDFYTTGPTGVDWCLEVRGEPGDKWRYNNCDYIVIGAVLEKVTGTPIGELIDMRIGSRIGWEETGLLLSGDQTSYVGKTDQYDLRIARYGASAGLVGPLEDMLRFDRTFFGRIGSADPIFSEESRDIMWDSDPALGYMGLGQWVFEAPLAGCDAPVKIVERRGGIGKYQLRNIIIPADKMVLAVATQKEGFEFGEIWTGSGVMYELLSEIACR